MQALRKRIQWNTRIDSAPVDAESSTIITWLACGTIGVERVEVMLSHRQVNGYYPRLAPGERLASKGGYPTRFADATGARTAAGGEWTVP